MMHSTSPTTFASNAAYPSTRGAAPPAATPYGFQTCQASSPSPLGGAVSMRQAATPARGASNPVVTPRLTMPGTAPLVLPSGSHAPVAMSLPRAGSSASTACSTAASTPREVSELTKMSQGVFSSLEGAVKRRQLQASRVTPQVAPVASAPNAQALLDSSPSAVEAAGSRRGSLCSSGGSNESSSSGSSCISNATVDNCPSAPAACRSRSELSRSESVSTRQRRASSASRRSTLHSHTASSRSKSASATERRRASSASRRSAADTVSLCESDKQLVVLAEDSVVSFSTDLRLERQRFEKAQEDHQLWLKKVLDEQVNDIEHEFNSVCKQKAEDAKRESILTQQRERAERVLQAKKELNDANRESVAFREKCITSERREKFAERNRLMDARMEAVSSEKKRLQDLRKASELEHIEALKKMKEEIRQFRESADYNSSSFNLDALRKRVDDVCTNLRH